MFKRVNPLFSVETFLSHSAEKIRRRHFWFVTNFGYPKFLRSRGSVHVILSPIFRSHSTENLRMETFLICDSELFPALKTFVDSRGVRKRISEYSVQIFLSQSPENFVEEPVVNL